MSKTVLSFRVRVLTSTALGGVYSRDVVVRITPDAFSKADQLGFDPVELVYWTIVESLRHEGVSNEQLGKLCMFDMCAVSADNSVSHVVDMPKNDSLVFFSGMSVYATQTFKPEAMIAAADAISPFALVTRDPEHLVVFHGKQVLSLPFPIANSIKELYAFITEHVGINVTCTRLCTQDGLMMNWSGRREVLKRYGLALFSDPSVVVEY